MTEKDIPEIEIDRYLEGYMTDSEKVNFEIRLADDTELQREVELQRSIIKAIRKEQLAKIINRKEIQIGKQNKIRKLVFGIGTFALAASLLGFFYVGYLNNCTSLANRYYVAYAYTPIPSRGGESLPLTRADSLFFKALTNLEKSKSSDAILDLQTLLDHPNELQAATNNVVKWYLSLAYLKNGKKQKAKALLQDIIKQGSGEFYSKAKDLLKEIDN